MKKLFSVVTLLACVCSISACDNAAQKKKEQCTQARQDFTDARRVSLDASDAEKTQKAKKAEDAKNTWNTLQCHQSDITTH